MPESLSSPSSRLWFTSDHHFGHDNIRAHCQRPFDSTEEMNEALIARWNACVAPSDTVYHLGDLFLCPLDEAKAIRRRLHGNICLIWGNHDKTADRMKESFGWVKDYYELKVEDADSPSGKQLIVLCHYAFRVWRNAHHGSWHLYGHSHGSLPGTGYSMDVGVDCHDFSPVSYEQVKAAFACLQVVK